MIATGFKFPYKQWRLLPVLLCLACILPGRAIFADEQPFTARVMVETEDVYVGEPLAMEIQVEGAENPDQPDLSGLADFEVESMGGRRNSSSSVVIVNGKVVKESTSGYVFSYRLTPKKAGTLTIPALSVTDDGRTALTGPVTIRARQPEQSDDFKLRLELSTDTAFVGQPVILTVIWYIRQDVEGFEFNLPVLEDARFEYAPVDLQPAAGEGNLFMRVPLGKGEVIAKKEPGELEGLEYMTLRFSLYLVPEEAGSLTIPAATVVGNVVTGYKQGRRNTPFNDPFFDNFFPFGQRRQPTVRKVVTPSNEPELTVLPLPSTGRPARFNGLVGQYSVAATASPTAVAVGDPITLNIMVTGPKYLDNVDLPDLAGQENLGRAFKIPTEMAPGKVADRVKTFTQTIRARNEGVTEIPPIELPYFDPDSGAYAVAKSEPIPLTVKSTRVITALDAEGRITNDEPVGSELETWGEGIAYNYEDPAVLESRPRGSGIPAIGFSAPFWMLALLGPPLAYFGLLFGVTVVRRRRADPEAALARRSFGELSKGLKHLEKKCDPARAHEEVLELFRRYLGAKLRLPARALTVGDIGVRLSAADVPADTVAAVVSFIEECEAGRYAGNAAACAGPDRLVSRATQLAADLEKQI